MTCHSDTPVWPVPRTYEDFHRAFLSKKRDEALRDVARSLYARLDHLAGIVEHQPLSNDSSYRIWEERQFLSDLLDMIERS